LTYYSRNLYDEILPIFEGISTLLDRLTWFSLFFCLISSLGCGRDLKEEKNKNEPRDINNERQVSNATRDFIRTQSIECEDDIFCNPSVGKIVIIDRGELKYCTGTLVKDDMVMTSSSCLIKSLRFPKIGCANSAVIIFPGDTFRESESSFCDEVIQASSIRDDLDPALRKNDVAYIRLRSRIERRPLKISRDGFVKNNSYTIWKSDFENTRRSVLKSRPCFPFHNSYANPFSRKHTSPIVTLFDCQFEDGNLGAPLINIKGEVVGVVSGEVDKSVQNYASEFLIEEMAPILNVSNLHCAYFPWDQITPDFDLECSKNINITALDRKRASILSDAQVHYDNMIKIKKEVEVYERYFLWNAIFRQSKSGHTFEIDMGRPRCFKRISEWIGEFTRWRGRVRNYANRIIKLPFYKISTKLNRLLFPVSEVQDLGEKEFEVEFNPADAFFGQSTYVDITREVFGAQSTLDFEDITNVCPTL